MSDRIWFEVGGGDGPEDKLLWDLCMGHGELPPALGTHSFPRSPDWSGPATLAAYHVQVLDRDYTVVWTGGEYQNAGPYYTEGHLTLAEAVQDYLDSYNLDG